MNNQVKVEDSVCNYEKKTYYLDNMNINYIEDITIINNTNNDNTNDDTNDNNNNNNNNNNNSKHIFFNQNMLNNNICHIYNPKKNNDNLWMNRLTNRINYFTI